MPLFDGDADTSDLPPDFFEGESGHGESGAGGQGGNVDDGRNPELSQAGPELSGENTPPEDGNGDLILGKYKTQEDFERAHDALERRLGQMRNELGQLRQQNTQQPQQQAEEPGWNDAQWLQYDQQFRQEFTRNPGRTIFNMVNEMLQQVIGPLQESLANQGVDQQRESAVTGELGLMLSAINDSGELIFPGAEEMAAEIDGYLDRHPELMDILANQGYARSMGQLDESAMGVLEVIYQAVQSEAALKAGQQAYQNGLQQGQRSAQVKNGVRLPAGGARQQNKPLSPEDQIVADIMSVRRGGLFD
ncbi:MAG TPA: hypothetical protein VN462_00245 [Negativicutes bacterium]|nr:hypothetical protein [Negativicutes bacterium]